LKREEFDSTLEGAKHTQWLTFQSRRLEK
jgi:hypothetical protein